MLDMVEDTGPVARRVPLPLDLSGDAVTALRAQLLDAVRESASGLVDVDAQDVERLDTIALGVLVAAHRAARSRGGALRIIHPNWLVVRRLEETGLNRVLRVVVDDFPPRPWSEIS